LARRDLVVLDANPLVRIRTTERKRCDTGGHREARREFVN
jgi:hypothetical protein